MARKQKSPSQKSGDNGTPATAFPAQEVEDTNVEIVSANLRALETVYFTAMLEEARLFEVVDRLVDMFNRGTLPLGPGRAGALLYRYWTGRQSRFTSEQRRTVYARAFGLPGGDEGVKPNLEFNDLWLRFVSIVGMYSAELQSLPPGERSVSAEEVLISGRALAVNLSSHGQGLAWFASKDLKSEVQQAIELISNSELQNALDAKDPWQVISHVAESEMGARPNVSRARTRAESGVIIIRWLANRRARLLRPRSANILKHEDICEGRTAASQNKKPNVYPTDSDLVTACEQWLGVTGTQEAELEEPASVEEPVPVPPVTPPVPREQPVDSGSEIEQPDVVEEEAASV